MKAYKLDELTILDDAVALIRRRPTMYLASETPGPTLAGALVHDIALLGALPVRVARDAAWWLVSGGADWLRTPSGAISTEPFFRIVPCPQWGLYAFRTEVLLTALAEAVVTAANGQIMWIAGDDSAGQLPPALRVVMEVPGVARHVAFRMAPDGRTPMP
jgi:hypothetical protein